MQLFGSRDPLACIRRPLVLGCAPSLSGVSQLLSVCFPADWLQRGATPAASPASVPRPPSCCSSPGRSSETARLSGLSSIALPCWCPSFRAVRIGGSRSVSYAVACLSTPSDYGQPVRLSFLPRRPHAGFGACAASLPRSLELYSRKSNGPARPRADAADRLRRFPASLGNALGERKCEPRRPRAAFGACPPPKQGRELGGHNRNLSTRECRGFAPLELFHDISISHYCVLWGINLSTAFSAILCI